MAILRQKDFDFFLSLSGVNSSQAATLLRHACHLFGLNRCKICDAPAISTDPERNLTNLHYCPDHIMMEEFEIKLDEILFL